MSQKSKPLCYPFKLILLLVIGFLITGGNGSFGSLSASESKDEVPVFIYDTADSSVMNTADSSVVDTADIDDGSDLSLEACISLSLKNNLEIQAQKNAVEEAFHKQAEQISLGKPKIGAQHIYNLQQRLIRFGRASLGEKETSITQVTLTQPIYTFGRLTKGLKLVRASYRAENANLAATRANIMHSVIRNFLGVLKNKNRIQIASETVAVLKEHLDLVKNLFTAGVVLNTDLSMTKVKMLEARQGLIEAKNRFDIARLALLQLIGIKRDTKRNFKDIPLIPTDIATTLKNPGCQPEMKSLGHLIEVGKQNYELAKRNNLPNIGLQTTWSTGNQFAENFTNWNANIVLDFPFFDSGSTRAKKKQALASLSKLKNIRDNARQKFDLAISQSARNVQELQEKFALAMQIRVAAEENFTNLRNRYREGAAINTDVLEAQLSWSNARIGVNNAYYDYVAFLADHRYSLGDIDSFVKLVVTARIEDSDKGRVNP